MQIHQYDILTQHENQCWNFSCTMYPVWAPVSSGCHWKLYYRYYITKDVQSCFQTFSRSSTCWLHQPKLSVGLISKGYFIQGSHCRSFLLGLSSGLIEVIQEFSNVLAQGIIALWGKTSLFLSPLTTISPKV